VNHPTARIFAVAGLAAALAACSAGAPPSSDLEARLAAIDDPDSFTMAYQAAGTDVLGCVQPNRSFAIDVDTPTLAFVVRDAVSGSTIAERHDRSIRLHRDLFAEGTTDAIWVEVDLDATADQLIAALRRVLGPDLAEYLLAAGPPSSGPALAAALVPIAASIEATDDDGSTTTFRLELDPGGFAEGATLAPDQADAAPPLIDLTLDDRGVRRIVVRAPGDEAAGGWIIDYVDPGAEVPNAPAPGSAVDLDDLATDDLRAPAIVGCAVGDETPLGQP
jgi:hypothetical protein